MMRCTRCDRTDGDVLDRTFMIDRRDFGGPVAQLGPLRLCAGCWERRREAFRQEVDEDWEAKIASVPAPESIRGRRRQAEAEREHGRRLDGDRGMRL